MDNIIRLIAIFLINSVALPLLMLWLLIRLAAALGGPRGLVRILPQHQPGPLKEC